MNVSGRTRRRRSTKNLLTAGSGERDRSFAFHISHPTVNRIVDAGDRLGTNMLKWAKLIESNRNVSWIRFVGFDVEVVFKQEELTGRI